MSYWKQQLITDIDNHLAQVTQSANLCVAVPVRVAGQAFNPNTFDPNFWTSTLTGSGTVTQTNGLQTIATGVTANSAVEIVSTDIGRFIGQSENQYVSQVQMGDTGTTNNVRRWGAFNGTDGAYFKLSGTSLYVATMKGGVETAVISTSWNGNQTVPTLTNLNNFRIEYNERNIIFYVNGNVSHTINSTSQWTNTTTLPCFHDNTNSGGSITNVSMSLAAATIYRLGQIETQPRYIHVAGAGTTVCKYGAGTLHRVCINTAPASGSATVTLYDNTAGSGAVMAVITGSSSIGPTSTEMHVSFNTGLTIVVTGTWDITVIYQ